jgi:protein involved in polysaccharide export with SLBB domain
MSKVVSRMTQVAALFALLLTAPLSVRAAEYTLRTDDKVKIKVYEWPELSAEFTVSQDGKITLPIIGELPVVGLRTGEVADAISDRLKKKASLPERPISMVEILQVRPIVVLGDVARPGEFIYRPGLTVLQAIGMAGGFYRPLDYGYIRFERDVITSRGDLDVLRPKIARLMAHQARLEAENEDRSDITFPPELAQNNNPSVVQILADERAGFAEARDGYLRKVENYGRVNKIYEQEIVSLTAQIQTEKAQQESVQKELDQVKEMATKGLGLAPRQLTLERTVLQLAEVMQSLETNILRARQNISTTEQLANDAKIDRRTKINTDLRTTRSDLEEARKRIDTDQRLIYEASVTGPRQAEEQQTAQRTRKHDVLVSRKQSGDVRKMPADETFLLEPGDVVEVGVAPPPGAAQADAVTRRE